MKIKFDEFQKIVKDYYFAKKPDQRVDNIKIEEKNLTGLLTDDWFSIKVEGEGFTEILKRKHIKKVIEYWLEKELPNFEVSNVIVDSECIIATTKERNLKIGANFTNRFFKWRN